MENAKQFEFYGEMDLNLNSELVDAITTVLIEKGYSFVENYAVGTLVRKFYVFNEKL